MIVGEIEESALREDGSALRIVGTEIHVPYMRLYDGTGTHVTGLECHIQITVEKMPGGQLAAGLRDAYHLRMKRRILLRLAEIVGTGYDPAVLDDDASDGGFA